MKVIVQSGGKSRNYYKLLPHYWPIGSSETDYVEIGIKIFSHKAFMRVSRGYIALL